MREYCISFEVDPENLGKINNLHFVPMPPRMPHIEYNFDTYTTGIAKGNNDVLDNLHEKNGEYDEFTDRKVECKDCGYTYYRNRGWKFCPVCGNDLERED